MKIELLFFSLFLLSCSNIAPPIFTRNQTQTLPNTRSNPPTGPIPTTTQTTGSGFGVIKCNNPNEADLFNKRLRAFLSTTIDPSGFGNHSCTKNLPGGVFFRGQVKTDRVFSIGDNNQDLIVSPNGSYLELSFETFQKNKANIQPITFQYTYGSINGQQAVLTFEDNKGEISLDGQIATYSDGKVLFTGVLSFRNFHKNWNGTAPFSGILGNFSIKACDLFQC